MELWSDMKHGLVLLPIVRQDDGTEDFLHVEIPSTATMADVKRKIADLIGVPQENQQLKVSQDRGPPYLQDTTVVGKVVESIGGFPLNLFSEAEQARHGRGVCQPHRHGEASDMQAAEAMAIGESLRGVTYSVRFVRPEVAGGRAAGKVVRLAVDALAFVGDVMTMVTLEMFGQADLDKEPIYLTFNGQLLPADVPLHFLGVGDGDTVIVASQLPCRAGYEREAESDSDSSGGHDGDAFDDAMHNWAAHG